MIIQSSIILLVLFIILLIFFFSFVLLCRDSVKHTLSWKKQPRHDDELFHSKTAAAGGAGAAGSKISSLRRISGGLVCGSEMQLPLFGFSDDDDVIL